MDLDDDNRVTFKEFISFILGITHSDDSPSKDIKTTSKEGKDITEKHSKSGAMHTYSDEEKGCFARVINEHLKDDQQSKELGLIPINIENDDLFTNCNNGLIFCKLVNRI